MGRASNLTIAYQSGFELTEMVSPEGFRDALDISSKARITGVEIEGISLNTFSLVGSNQADSLKITGRVYDEAIDKFTLFVDFKITTHSGFEAIDILEADGINFLNGKLDDLILNLDNTPFFVELTGTSIPEGVQTNIVVWLNIKASVKYEECVETWDYISEADGSRCTSD